MNTAVYTDYSPMIWNREYSLEVPEFDTQHKELIGFYNAVIGNCSGNMAEERTYFDKTIGSFIKFLSIHFEAEELFLSETDYAQYEEHKLDHAKLLEKIHFIKNEIQNNRWEMKLFILAITLKDMLMYHFNTYDISAKVYFKEGNSIPADDMRTEGTDNYFDSRVCN